MIGRKTIGLIFLSMGIGMLFVLFMPGGSLILAFILAIVGLYFMLFC